MSPILVRPVREQLEHDRVIRLLQAKYKRKFDVAINPGNAQLAPVGGPAAPWFPDLVLQSTDKSRKIVGIVEVETVESVNHLEAMAEWVPFSRLKTAFHLYVPAAMVDVARRFCSDFQVNATEIWAYSAIGEQIRFTLVQKAPGGDATSAPTGAKARTASPTARPAKGVTPSKPAKPAKPAPAKVKTAAKSGAKASATKPGASKPASKVAAKSAKAAGKSKPAPKRTAAARPVSRSAHASSKSSGSRKPAGRAAKRK